MQKITPVTIMARSKDVTIRTVGNGNSQPEPTAMKNTTPTTKARPKQAAAYFQISTMTLHRWRQKEGFPQPLKTGQVVLYDLTAIERWLEGEAA